MGANRQILNIKIVFESARFRVIEQEVMFSDGQQTTLQYVEHKTFGGVRICAVTKRGELIFVREYQVAAGRYVVRLPTGSLHDIDEDPAAAARRELEEETGFYAEHVEVLYKQVPTSSYFKSGPTWGCFATNLKKTKTRRDIGERDMEIVLIPIKRAYRMLENCEFEDMGTQHAILRIKKRLKRGITSRFSTLYQILCRQIPAKFRFYQ